MNFGEKIKSLRLKNELTQSELADRSELTKGYISQLENNQTSPSMETLFNILEVLGTDPAHFFSAEDEDEVCFKEDDFYINEDKKLKHTVTWIVPTALRFQMEPIIIEILPQGQSVKDAPHHGEEFGYVLEGEITLHLNKRKITIAKGQSFYYKANKQHYLVNNSTTNNAKILWVSTPPMF